MATVHAFVAAVMARSGRLAPACLLALLLGGCAAAGGAVAPARSGSAKVPPAPMLPGPDGWYVFADGKRYKGDVQAGRPHGRGVLVLSDGQSRFEGEFRDGQGVSGQLSLRLPDGTLYEGGASKGVFHGAGRLVGPSGAEIKGRFAHEGTGRDKRPRYRVDAATFTAGGWRCTGVVGLEADTVKIQGPCRLPGGTVRESTDPRWTAVLKAADVSGPAVGQKLQAAASGTFREKYPDGSVFDGRLNGGVKDGPGIYTGSDGRTDDRQMWSKGKLLYAAPGPKTIARARQSQSCGLSPVGNSLGWVHVRGACRNGKAHGEGLAARERRQQGYVHALVGQFQDGDFVGGEYQVLSFGVRVHRFASVGRPFRNFTRNGVFADHRDGQAFFRGSYVPHEKYLGIAVRHGEATCFFEGQWEPCAYASGKRVDEIHTLRLAEKKRRAQVEREEKCSQLLSSAQQRLDALAKDLDDRPCAKKIASAADDVRVHVSSDSTQLRRSDGADFVREANACLLDEKKDFDRGLRKRYGELRSAIVKDSCASGQEIDALEAYKKSIEEAMAKRQEEDDKYLTQLAKAFDEAAVNARRRDRAAEQRRDRELIAHIRRHAGPVIETPLTARTNEMIAQALKRYESRRTSDRDRAQQIARERAKQAIRTGVQRSRQPTRSTTPADPHAAQRAACHKRAQARWDTRLERCVVRDYGTTNIVLKNIGVACSGPNCDKIAPARSQSSAESGKTTGGSGATPGGAASGARASGGRATPGGSAAEARAPRPTELGPARVEAIAVCNQNKAGFWWCDGPVQNLIVGEKTLREALEPTGCEWADPNQKRHWRDNKYVYFCGYGLTGGDYDMVKKHALPDHLLVGRRLYQCPKYREGTRETGYRCATLKQP